MNIPVFVQDLFTDFVSVPVILLNDPVIPGDLCQSPGEKIYCTGFDSAEIVKTSGKGIDLLIQKRVPKMNIRAFVVALLVIKQDKPIIPDG